MDPFPAAAVAERWQSEGETVTIGKETMTVGHERGA